MIYSKQYNPNMNKIPMLTSLMDIYLQSEPCHLLKAMDIEAKLDGWEKILRDKCLKNELMDVKTINAPDLNIVDKDMS